MNELKIVNESEYTGEETSPAITFVNSEDGSRVVFAGNVAEYGKINNQEKSVEITEAGVTEIVPDKGYTGLSKVSVDTSAISGGSGEGGGSNIEYFAYDKEVYALIGCAAFAQYIKAEVEGQYTLVAPFSAAIAEMMAALSAEVVAFGIDFNERMAMKQGDMIEEYTILDTIMRNGVSREEIESLPRITKEEFYSLD